MEGRPELSEATSKRTCDPYISEEEAFLPTRVISKGSGRLHLNFHKIFIKNDLLLVRDTDKNGKGIFVGQGLQVLTWRQVFGKE